MYSSKHSHKEALSLSVGSLLLAYIFNALLNFLTSISVIWVK